MIKSSLSFPSSNKVVKLIQSSLLIMAIILMSGCASKSIVLRNAPKEGVYVKGINVLYRTFPLTSKGSTDVEKIKDITYQSHPEMEILGKDISERMLSQPTSKGIKSNFTTLDVLPGVAQTPMKDLFPSNSSESYYTLIITPIQERIFCYKNCSTTYTVSLSLRTPNENKEVWNLLLKQSELSLSDIMPFRNNQFIDDMTGSILAVVHK